MGLFVTGAAGLMVILQTSLLLMNRDPTSWSFTLVRRRSVPPDRTAVASLFQKGGTEDQLLQAVGSHPTSSLTQCVLARWRNGGGPFQHCFLWYHPSHNVEPVLTPWNPHLILHCITCIHCIVSLYAGAKQASSSLLPVAGGLFFLWLVVALVVGFAQVSSSPLLRPCYATHSHSRGHRAGSTSSTPPPGSPASCFSSAASLFFTCRRSIVFSSVPWVQV